MVDAVIWSGRAVSETAAVFAVSWGTVRAALNEASLLTLPDVDQLSPKMLGIGEHRFLVHAVLPGPGLRVVDPARPTGCCSCAGETLTGNEAHRLAELFAADGPAGRLEAVWKVKEQLRLLRANSLADAAGRPETNKLYRTV